LPPPGFFFAAKPKPEVFVFVNSGHFGEPVRPSTVVFKNNVIFGKTSEVGGVKRETRSGISAGTQPVMVNQGPKLEEVQKATGKTFRAVPIQEAARRTATASYKRGGEPKTTPAGHGKETTAAREPDRKDHDIITAADRSGPPSGGPWQSAGTGGGHGHGGGHGKEHD
jgi:hypothetical protein